MSIEALNYFHAHARPILLSSTHTTKNHIFLYYFFLFFTLFRVKDFPYFKFI